MKKVLATSVVTLVCVLVTSIVLSGGATAGQKIKHVTPAEKPCTYLENPKCPLSPEQKAALEVYHPVDSDIIDAIDISNLDLPSIGQNGKKN